MGVEAPGPVAVGVEPAVHLLLGLLALRARVEGLATARTDQVADPDDPVALAWLGLLAVTRRAEGWAAVAARGSRVVEGASPAGDVEGDLFR